MDPEGVPLLHVCGLSIAYRRAGGSNCAVEGVSLSIARGEALGLLGESGSGKSSIALAILGLLPPHASVSGSIRFDGLELTALPERRLETIRGARIAMIYQEPELALNPVRTAGAQIAAVMRAHGSRGKEQERARSLGLLREAGFGGDASRILASYPHQLSGGARQRVLIAQALAADPELLVADEPTASVDAAIQAEILAMLRRLQQTRRLAMLFISHSPAVLSAVADRLCVLSGGRVIEEGPADRLLTAAAHPRTRALVDAGRGRGPRRATPMGAERPALLEIRGLAKAYTERRRPFGSRAVVTAVADASLTIPEGSTVGLVGASGSGKSTLARCLARLEEPDAGSIRFRGTDVRSLRGEALRRYRREVQLIFQDPAGALNPRFTAESIVEEPLAVQGMGPASERRAKALALMAEVGLPPGRAGDPPASFSGGERQRLAIARALTLEPSLLVLDEAFSGIDLPVQRQILDLLDRLRLAHAFACLVISHDVALVSEIADQILVMHEGRILEAADSGEPLRRYA